MEDIINDKTLDDLMLKEGTEINDIKIVPKEKVEKELNLSYNTNNPLPGENIDKKMDSVLDGINKETALNDLIHKATMSKMEKFNKKNLSKEEKQQAKKQFIDSLLYHQGEAFYEKYHYMMDSQTKRRYKRKIERDYDLGKFNTSTNLNQ